MYVEEQLSIRAGSCLQLTVSQSEFQSFSPPQAFFLCSRNQFVSQCILLVMFANPCLCYAFRCVFSPSDTSQYVIYVGRLQLNGWNPFESSYRINRVVVPYGYTDPRLGKDIALVELASPITWSDYVQPVCLPNGDVSFSGGTQCTITGWGDIRDGGELGWKWWAHRLDLTLTRKDPTLTSEYFRKKLAFLLLLLLNNQFIIIFFNVGLTHSSVYIQLMSSTHLKNNFILSHAALLKLTCLNLCMLNLT